MLFQKIQRCSKEKVWGKHLMGKSYSILPLPDIFFYFVCPNIMGKKAKNVYVDSGCANWPSSPSCINDSWQSRPDHIQGALLIGQWPEPTRSRLQVHEPGQSSCHVELPQGMLLMHRTRSPLSCLSISIYFFCLSHPSFHLTSPPFREQLLVSTWSQPRLGSSWLHFCPSSCPVCTATSLTPTWAFARPWPASGMRWSLIRPW